MRRGVVAFVVHWRGRSVGRAVLGVCVALLGRKEVCNLFSLLGQKSAGLSGSTWGVIAATGWRIFVVFETFFFAAQDSAAVWRDVQVDERLLDELALFVGGRLERDERVNVDGAQRNSTRNSVRAVSRTAASVVRIDCGSGSEEVCRVTSVSGSVLWKSE